MKTVLILMAYVKLSYVQISLKDSYQYVAIIAFVKIGQIPKKKKRGFIVVLQTVT